MAERTEIAGSRRWVVKVGSALLTDDGRGLDEGVITSLVDQLAHLRARQYEVVLVSSGAVAAGIVRLATEPETARRLAAAARERVARYFTVDALTEQTLAVYRHVLAGEVGPTYPVAPAP